MFKKFRGILDGDDMKILELKQMCKDYDRRAQLALIPFFMDRLQFLKKEIEEKSDSDKPSKKEIEFLKRIKKNLSDDLDKEKTELKQEA